LRDARYCLGRVDCATANLLERVKDGGELFERACVLRPDIIVSDISMPVMNGMEVMRRLKACGLPARFIFLTGHADEQLAIEALSEGAAGFLVKPVAIDDMREAIQAVASGSAYVPTLSSRAARSHAR
jgi:DNA-binding NarL/FixJ family response regulator